MNGCVHEYLQKIHHFIGIENSTPFMSLQISLKDEVSNDELADRIRKELLSVIQTALDETFAWLMTQ